MITVLTLPPVFVSFRDTAVGKYSY